MTGFPLLIVLILILIVMILSIAKYKVHPFLAIITASIVFALIGGIPLVDTKTAAGLAKVIGQGFSGTFTSIGIVIILGALIGSILETTGAGAMTVSHANDSYFWVVTNFDGLNTQEGYKTQTAVTFIEGISSIVFIYLLSLLF